MRKSRRPLAGPEAARLLRPGYWQPRPSRQSGILLPFTDGKACPSFTNGAAAVCHERQEDAPSADDKRTVCTLQASPPSFPDETSLLATNHPIERHSIWLSATNLSIGRPFLPKMHLRCRPTDRFVAKIPLWPALIPSRLSNGSRPHRPAAPSRSRG